MLKTFDEIRDHALSFEKKRVVIPMAEDETSIRTAIYAFEKGFAESILIGREEKIRETFEKVNFSHDNFEIMNVETPEEASFKAVSLAREGKADIILKGYMHTHLLLKAVLNSEHGLRTGRLLSDVLIAEDPASNYKRIVGMSDGGINVLPNLEQKKQIIENAVKVFHLLGYSKPKVALLAAVEVVNEAMPATIDAAELTRMNREGEIKDCIVHGPLALDLAVSKEAAKKKKIESEVAGEADILIVPNIEAGNILGKAFTYYTHSKVGHVIVGAKIPILIPSRNESENDKLNSIALSIIVSQYRDKI
ncbi:bifunctional enoyl-CoA hydratase/phosphate acetyltransferase [Candidatus Aminicenantes bacterium AC-708-M15]|jgi:phosphate butyryltransferase|nr:bifunctional enoyl-CoA hydratase/phosphate acetyltransferase [SCandidatus Aminicenantes bacterium Aminicenantia_JdfR_composite]MCP2596527.1 bifunctional enoyl-CoA hydratase/phosphate acetyltransferase [Candidatus Aminicenantes bacterium AC-335-G13]MCP2603924.1 bifunctional enoyl-CoA hydratase/phosphate acetyltransferase [Candidatus Aminicenantes bacterium AC-708-M15]MCP2605734.1 bifunctional enoyl-CoA hydratase/phosphate acetyltransferase [Candidatus Aminicenantes bacterium AC-335-O07]MCP261